MITGELRRYNSISRVEVAAAHAAVHEGVLSGFLGGELRGGRWVRELEDEWCKTFNVKHAIACNSATSGLLAAAHAVGRGRFAVSPLTMSATAAAPVLLNAEPVFVDVEGDTFCLNNSSNRVPCNSVIVTNLFGHPARLGDLRAFCDDTAVWMIEDNSQSPFAMEDGKYAGTFGDIGVFSLNVHKHIQSGEGGVCVTNDDGLDYAMRLFINHGEMASGSVGLNLRMNEVTAAIAYAQLVRGPRLVQQRVEIAEAIIAAIGPIPGVRMPVVRPGCKHVYYTIPFLIETRRATFVSNVEDEGVPLVEGYVDPLYRLPAFSTYAQSCPVAEALHDRRLFYYENCAWDPTPLQIKEIGEAFQKVAEAMKL